MHIKAATGVGFVKAKEQVDLPGKYSLKLVYIPHEHSSDTCSESGLLLRRCQLT